jgi:hypothetical protein
MEKDTTNNKTCDNLTSTGKTVGNGDKPWPK